MDKKRSVLNISVSVASRIILLLAALLVRRLLIQRIGNEVNGLNSLYSGIIGMLAVAELGVGRAIVYSMYKPIVDGENRQVAALFQLYQKLYRIIGAAIFAAGMILMPFLPVLIDDYDKLSVNVYSTFLLTLIAVSVSYLYSAKSSLIEAYKDNYITTIILTVSRLFRYLLQIVSLLLWESYTAFLICQIIETLVIWAITHKVARRKHGDILALHETADAETKRAVARNVKALLMHRFGSILVSCTDSMIISGFIGVAALGRYTNYTYIAGIMSGTIGLVFTPLTSIMGHLCAAGDPKQSKRYFDYFYCVNFILGIVFFLGYYAVIDEAVRLCFGPSLEVSRTVSFIITLDQFLIYMRKTMLLFRDASGTFYYDRWRPLLEGIINLVLSLIFVKIFPEEYKVAGVIAATIVTCLLVVFTIEPYVVFKRVFCSSQRQFYVRNYGYITIFTICMLIMTRSMQHTGNDIINILLNGTISVVLSGAALLLVAAVDRSFRKEVQTISRKILSSARIIRS